MIFLSDERAKENIKPTSGALEKIKKIRSKTYNYKMDPEKTPQLGVIAQEIEKIVPEAVVENQEGVKFVNYGALASLAIEGIVELIDKEEAKAA